ncbi:copper resistance CopC family protein [Parafrankia sp. FMc2]|uniref:copper resistance CopC family protein n=1 Tax=Parafrankia sp. FMc2 TaxID=3233196 RepID=UPI0034D430B7
MHRRSRAIRSAATLVVALAALTVTALGSPAWAHTALTASDPAAGATLDTVPGQLSLTFSGLVRADGSTVTVTGGAGAPVTVGAPSAADTTLTVPVTGLAGGGYQVVWRVIAGDGHAMNGEFSFTVAAPAPPPTPTPTQTSTSAPTSAPTAAVTSATSTAPEVIRPAPDDSGGGHGWIIAVIGAGIAAFAIIAATFVIRRRRPTRREP